MVSWSALFFYTTCATLVSFSVIPLNFAISHRLEMITKKHHKSVLHSVQSVAMQGVRKQNTHHILLKTNLVPTERSFVLFFSSKSADIARSVVTRRHSVLNCN